MLILQRKKNQAIVLGHDIEIKITEIKGDTVKIGITAPRNITVHRKEVYEMIQKQNQKAATAQFDDLDQISQFLLKKS